MTDLLNPALIQEVMEAFFVCVGAGLATSGIITALSWVVSFALRLVHKMT